MSHTCVSAVGSALTWLGRGYPIQRASSHRARPRRLRAGQRSCPATGRFDRRVFFALGWLLWVRWSAQWPRSSKIPKSWSGLRAGAGLSGPVCGLSGARSTRASTSTRGLLRPRAAASMSRLRGLLVSSPCVAVRVHGERCRPCLICTLCGRALCNGCNDLFGSPQIYGGPKRPISIVYTPSPTDWIAWNLRINVRVSSCEHVCSP